MKKTLATILLVAIVLIGWTPARASVLAWQSVGPYDIRWLEISPSNPDVLYAQNGMCNLQKSLDGGASWFMVSPSITCGQIAIHPADPMILYRYTLSSSTSIIYRSADGGVSWTPLDPGVTSHVTLFAVEPLPPYRLFISQYSGGTRVSADQGQTWGLSTYPGYNAFQMIFLGAAPGTILARDWNMNFYKSVNGGATWTQGEGLPYGHSSSLVVDLTAPTNLYMGDSDTGNVYASTDQGDHWSLTVLPLPIAFDPGTHGIYYAMLSNLLKRSDDGGETWTSIQGRLPAPISSFSIDPLHPNKVYALTALGLYASTDRGANWSMLPVASNYGGGYVMSLAKGPGNQASLYAGLVNVSGSYAGVIKSSEAGKWLAVPANMCGSVLAADPLDANTLYGSCKNLGVIKSEDGGDTWLPLGTGLTNPYITALALADHGATLYAGARYYAATDTSGGVFTSKNSGASWTISRTGMSSSNVQTLAIDPTDSDIVYAGMLSGVGIYKSVDGGQSWVQKNNGLTSTDVRALVVLPSTPATVLAGTYGGGIFISTNGGDTWAPANTGISVTPRYAYAFALDPIFPNTIYAGMGTGVYRSINAGASWEAINQGIPTGVTSLLFDPSSKNTLYAGSFGFGIYKLTLPQGYMINIPFVTK